MSFSSGSRYGLVYPPWRVVEIVTTEFFPRRGCEYEGPPLSQDLTITQQQHHGYMILRGRKPTGKSIVVAVIAEGSKYASHAPDLRQLISLAVNQTGQRDLPSEVIIVAPEETISKKNMIDAVRTQQEEPRAEPIAIKLRGYSLFCCCVPDAACVPPHEVLSPEEADRVLSESCLAPRDLEVIYDSEPIVDWLGAAATKPPTIIRVVRPSQTAGAAVTYRRIAKDPRK